MMNRTKYIAEGFTEDVEKLLTDFVETNSVEFSTFTEIWKMHHFSLVFMGRPDQVETSEFTNEAYRISMAFLSGPSVYQKIGTVYLLYALYRNQIADPPVKIRIDLPDWKLVLELHQFAKNQQHKILQYVIDYLIINAFLYVANYTLKGPLMGSLPEISNESNMLSLMASTYRSDIEECAVTNNLQKLRDLREEYSASKKRLDSSVKFALSIESNVYDRLISEFNELVNPTSGSKALPSIGTRRSQIKHKSFQKETFDRLGQAILEDKSDSDADGNLEISHAKKRERKKPKRTPKHERRVGRPSEKVWPPSPVEEKSDHEDDIDLDITHLVEQQRDLYLPPEEEEGKKAKSKPGRFYYQLSPKHVSDASDSD